MFCGPLALFERSLRLDARTLESHIARFSMTIAIYVVVVCFGATSPIYGASGLRCVVGIAYLDFVFLTLMAIGIFSSVITEEREDGMLDLILLSGISPLGILLSKSGARLIQALLLIAVQYPFLMFAITLGGVTSEQIRALYLALFAYAFMLVGIGVVCSTFSRLHRSASILMMLVVAGYCVVPLLCDRILLNKRTVSSSDALLKLIADSSLFMRIDSILTTGFHESLWSGQVVSNLCIGVIGVFVSWMLFSHAAIEPEADAHRRERLAHSKGPIRWFSPGRAWANPMMWKDFFFVAGGVPAVVIRFAVYLSIYPIAARVVMSIFGGTWPPEAANIATQFYLVSIAVGLFADAGNLIARSFYQEVQAQTLGTLMLLPTSSARTLYSKVVGLLLVVIPGVLCLLLGIAVLPFGTANLGLLFTAAGYCLWISVHLLLIPHAAALWAIYGRQKALSLAIFTVIGSQIVTGCLIGLVDRNQNGFMTWFAALAVLGACGICQRMVQCEAERQ